MMTYDAKLHAISLHTFTTFKKAAECSREVAKRQGIIFGDIVDVIFATIPVDFGLFYIYTQDTLAYGKKMEQMMRNADMKTGLYYLRVFARSQSSDRLLVKLYDIFTKKHTLDEFRAWNAIEMGVAERHLIYDEDPLSLTGESPLFRTIQRVVEVFHAEGKTWIQQYPPPPAVGGTRFLSTVLLTHFGYLIQHDKEIDINKYASSSIFKKQRGLHKKEEAKEAVLELIASAVGMYAKSPAGFSNLLSDYSRAAELVEEYQNYNMTQ